MCSGWCCARAQCLPESASRRGWSQPLRREDCFVDSCSASARQTLQRSERWRRLRWRSRWRRVMYRRGERAEWIPTSRCGAIELADRLREHQAVAVRVVHVEFDLAVLLAAERARDVDVCPLRELIKERLHVVGLDVNIPRFALAGRGIGGLAIAGGVLLKDLHVLT